MNRKFILQQVFLGLMVSGLMVGLAIPIALYISEGLYVVAGSGSSQIVVVLFTLESVFLAVVTGTVQLRLQKQHDLIGFYPDLVILVVMAAIALKAMRDGLASLSQTNSTLFGFTFEVMAVVLLAVGLSGVGIVARWFVQRYGFIEPDIVRKQPQVRTIEGERT